MALVSKNHTFSPGATILAVEHNENFDTLYNLVNGNIDNANISGSAGIVDSKLAQISTGGKVSGSSLTSLGSVPAGGGSLPTANGGMPIGASLDYFLSTLPTGYLWADGTSIGDGSSGGTQRANSDTRTLFEGLWTATANTELVIQDSSGTPTTRGASATADFDAHKRMPLPDLRGRVTAGKDNLGGTSANVITDTEADALADTLGAATHTLTTTEMPAHTHGLTMRNSNGAGSMVQESADSGGSGAQTTSSSGSGGAHNNIQPTTFCNKIIRYA